MTPAFQGEVQYRYHADSPKGGQQIVLQLPSREELGSFIGKEGRRFMAVFVEIGDDEQPVTENQVTAVRTRERQPIGENCYWSVLRCAEPVFWDFLNQRFPGPEKVKTAAQAAEVVKFVCGVESRKEFDTNPEARIAFKRQIRDPWHRHFLAGSER
jgi:hypothetical protein